MKRYIMRPIFIAHPVYGLVTTVTTIIGIYIIYIVKQLHVLPWHVQPPPPRVVMTTTRVTMTTTRNKGR